MDINNLNIDMTMKIRILEERVGAIKEIEKVNLADLDIDVDESEFYKTINEKKELTEKEASQINSANI